MRESLRQTPCERHLQTRGGNASTKAKAKQQQQPNHVRGKRDGPNSPACIAKIRRPRQPTPTCPNRVAGRQVRTRQQPRCRPWRGQRRPMTRPQQARHQSPRRRLMSPPVAKQARRRTRIGVPINGGPCGSRQTVIADFAQDGAPSGADANQRAVWVRTQRNCCIHALGHESRAESPLPWQAALNKPPDGLKPCANKREATLEVVAGQGMRTLGRRIPADRGFAYQARKRTIPVRRATAEHRGAQDSVAKLERCRDGIAQHSDNLCNSV